MLGITLQTVIMMVRKIIFLFIISVSQACGQNQASSADTDQTNNIQNQDSTIQKSKSMKVEIWSDIMCPFCYIGKRNFEAAMANFPDKDKIVVEWKSFQLDPDIPQQIDENTSVYQYLADRKGISYEQSVAMHERVIDMAKNVGLTYNYDKAVVANSFNAHRLIQLAKTKGLGDQAEEHLFRAYFTEGKNFSDPKVLEELGKDIGISEADVKEALSNDDFAFKVNQDLREAESIGVTGVPFFVFDRKYAISGAQPSEMFLQALGQSFNEWKMANPDSILQVNEGPSCTPQGKCD